MILAGLHWFSQGENMRFLIVFLMLSFNAFAQDTQVPAPAEFKDLVICHGEFEFAVRKTAAVNFFQGFLKLSDTRSISMVCKKGTAPLMNWNCVENRQGDGKILVDVKTNSATHMLSADLKQEQVFPLKPKTFMTLSCFEAI
jgi:hypothetical protein